MVDLFVPANLAQPGLLALLVAACAAALYAARRVLAAREDEATGKLRVAGTPVKDREPGGECRRLESALLI